MRTWTLNSRGLALRVLELADGDGAPIVCLHGWLDQGAAFAPVAAGQPGRWVALDQRGHGGSAHVGAGGYYHFPDYLADLDALVRTLGGPVRLVGHSMGGTVACMYAGARPSQVSALVCVEGLGALEVSDPSMLSRTRQHLDGLASPPPPLRVASVEAAAERLVKRHEGLSPEHALLLAEHGTRADERGYRWSFDPLHMTRAPYPFREDAFGDFLAEITAPTLLIWGEAGWYPHEIQASRAARIRDVRQRTLPGGHMLPYSASVELGDAISGFFAEVGG